MPGKRKAPVMGAFRMSAPTGNLPLAVQALPQPTVRVAASEVRATPWASVTTQR